MKPKILHLALVMLIAIQGCASPIPQPSQLPIASVTPTHRPANTPIPLQTNVPTNTPLPPLPDFSEHLYFAFGGGAGGTCDGAGEVQIDYLVQRSGTLCVYGVPLGIDFHISLTSPDGKTSLEGDFKVMDFPDGPQVIWVGHEKEEHYAEIYSLDNNKATIRFPLWWAGELPTGEWKAYVSWDGNESNDIFKVPASQQAEIYLVDSRSDKDILLSSAAYHTCHRANDSKNLSIGGNNFPPAELIYLLVYQKTPENEWLTEKVAQQAVLADNAGKFETVLMEALSPGGEYWVIAGTSSDFVDSNIEESMLDPANIGNAIDCFHVP